VSTLADKVVNIAKSQVGYHEGRSNGHWNNKEKYAEAMPDLKWVSDQGQPWCAVFVSWVAEQAGVKDKYPRTASTDVGARWFKNAKQWSEYPAVPAQVFLGTNGDMYHTGIVYDFDATYIYTIEGNTNTDGSAEGDGVYLKKRERRDPHVQGYGYPDGLIVKSADPKFVVKQVPPPAKTPTTPAPPAKPPVKAGRTAVEKARPELLKGIAELDKAMASRKQVHNIAGELRKLVDSLPQK
jgi:hypothetical protein